MGEITDLFNAYLWRLERERMELARQTIVIGRGWGADLNMEKVLGRKPHPFLRTVEVIGGDEALVDGRPLSSKLEEIRDVKGIFQKVGLPWKEA
jgi:hypothetical protein